MRKNLMRTSIMFFAVALIFSACTKSNVKYGNKRIIGTWKLQSENIETTTSGSSSTVYSDTYCYSDQNSSSSYTGHSTETLEGSSYHYVSTYTSTYNDGQQQTNSIDTTYNVEQSSEITFNEDGTCTIKEHYRDTYENGEYESETYEITGTWAWIDSYKEKAGIEISFDSENFMYMFIEDLTKDELKFNYTYVNNTETENVYNNTCYDYNTGEDIEYTETHKNKSNRKETGTRTMKK